MTESENDFEVLSVKHDVKEMFLDLMPKSWGSQGDCVRKLIFLLKFLRENRIEITFSNVSIFKTEKEIGSCINGIEVLKQFEKWYSLQTNSEVRG